MTGKLWTPRLDARLLELHHAGYTFTQIAWKLNAEFGTSFTKNACVGRGHRLHVPLREPRALPGTPRPRLTTINDLRDGVCHWPSEGDKPPYTYCGAPTWNGGSFCREHFQRAYVIPAKRWA